MLEASIRRKLTLGEPISGFLGPSTVPTLTEFADRFLREYVPAHNKPSEQRNKRQVLRRHLLPHLGKLPLDQLTPRRIDQFTTRKLEEGLSAKTVHNMLTILGRLLTVAHEWEVIPSRPKIRKPKLPVSPFDFLNAEESQKLLTAVDDPYWRRVILLALRTGMRFGELVGLLWTEVDLEHRRLRVARTLVRGQVTTPKSNRTRVIPLSRELCRELASWEPKTGLVLGRGPLRRPPDHKTMREALRRFCDSAGIRRVKWHALRHSFASQLVANGVSIRAVQEFLGHSDIRVTMRYSHLEPSVLLDAVDGLDEVRSDQHKHPSEPLASC